MTLSLFFFSAEDCDAILHVDATGSSLSGQNSELRIVSVQGHGGRELLVDDHDTLFTASLNSPSADYSVGKGTSNNNYDSLLTINNDSYWRRLLHKSFWCNVISFVDLYKVHFCANNYFLSLFFLSAEDCDAASEILRVDATGSSGLSGQNSALRIVSVQGHGGRELVVDGHDTLFTASLNSPSADYKGTSNNNYNSLLTINND